MKKDFGAWHRIKERINDGPPISFYYQEREIWWCSLGANIGHEEDGKGAEFKRPVVVLKKLNRDTLWAIPLTTQIKTHRLRVPIQLEDGIKRDALISHLRSVDSRRLSQRIGLISTSTHRLLMQALESVCESNNGQPPPVTAGARQEPF